ncbi:biotin-independent malonate decarboxylase subunit gamma [Legionella bononiensis]|uniref:Malonate decarboxylase subunit gamma n=1 Tax=Legionella bononiensis TaxID=2793102 RepID=A0ABS1W9B6_9GAMM|nr:biotin-independent malonate decarboxylase subunit gamma [Legionella bononiensis]MBL7480865.1 malonate decarboxylase subunit gamma [Legionella bononiensis]MBL7525953.1 malonate decarboxylase subunit gamma [Legionella bononiensis]MBL7563980.1 malonate decarboxylase subunit gamma [Legionella bononiensis]
MIRLNEVMDGIFGTHYQLNEKSSVIFGKGQIGKQQFQVLGVKESTYLGAEQALIMAEKIIDLIEQKSKDPLLLLVDVAGQQLTMRDEWLGMHQYFGHLLTGLACLRQQGNQLISLVYNQAVGGGFIAYGLMADTILALPDAELAVMWLEGIAKVTKIELGTLEELSKSLPIFAPGVNNFYKLGGLHQIVELSQIPGTLEQLIKQDNKNDVRAQLGKERGGRTLAYTVINTVENMPL